MSHYELTVSEDDERILYEWLDDRRDTLPEPLAILLSLIEPDRNPMHVADLFDGYDGKNNWPPEDRDIYEFLDRMRQETITSIPLPMERKWWEQVSIIIGGIDKTTLQVEFTKMEEWLRRNSRKRPKNLIGVKRFIRTWLERSTNQGVGA